MNSVMHNLIRDKSISQDSVKAAAKGNRLAILIADGVAAPVNIPVRRVLNPQELADIQAAHKRREEKLNKRKWLPQIHK